MFMLYESKLKKTMLDVLNERMSGIAGCIKVLFENGYIPNKNKMTILNWTAILINAYKNVEVMTKEQQNKLDNIYNKVIRL